jgi:hypothetical protein
VKDVEFMLVYGLIRNSRTSDIELARKAGTSQPTVTRIVSLHLTNVENLEEEWDQ